jgi:hypothetical protein
MGRKDRKHRFECSGSAEEVTGRRFCRRHGDLRDTVTKDHV